MPTIKSSKGPVALRYETIRNLTSPEEKANGAKSYFANIPVSELLKLDTAANLRDYIPDHPGKKRSQVHKQIGATLQERSDRFIQLSGGITVSATEIEVDDNKKLVTVSRGSIINGAQTQGEIRLYLQGLEDEAAKADFHARVEFMVDPDKEFIVETAIARNTSTNVQKISMVGKKKYLEELSKSFKKRFPKLDISRSETQVEDNYIDTQRLLQVLWAMMPESLLPDTKRSVAEARLKSYKNRAYCLLDFEKDVLLKEKEPDEETRSEDIEKAAARYKYFVDMAGDAWAEYERWRHHEKWHGTYLHERTKAIRRDDDGGYTVADGVIFPIISALSHFVKKDRSDTWALDIPPVFDDAEMIEAARDQLSSYDANPMYMGRTAAVYESLSLLPKMVNRLAGRIRLRSTSR